MITKFNCSCGNTDPSKAKEYDGCLGYSALICTVCGRYYDENGEHPADDWSKDYVTEKERGIRIVTAENKRKIGVVNIGLIGGGGHELAEAVRVSLAKDHPDALLIAPNGINQDELDIIMKDKNVGAFKIEDRIPIIPEPIMYHDFKSGQESRRERRKRERKKFR